MFFSVFFFVDCTRSVVFHITTLFRTTCIVLDYHLDHQPFNPPLPNARVHPYHQKHRSPCNGVGQQQAKDADAIADSFLYGSSTPHTTVSFVTDIDHRLEFTEISGVTEIVEITQILEITQIRWHPFVFCQYKPLH